MTHCLITYFNITHYITSHYYLIICYYLPYSRKYWRSIKFGGLAVGAATIKFKSVKFKCDLRLRVRAYYMYGTTTKFKSANIFISAARDQTAKFKDRQYFRLYGISFKLEGFLYKQVIFQLDSDNYTIMLQGACTVSY